MPTLYSPTKLYKIDDWQLQLWNKPQKGSSPINYFEDPTTGDTYYYKESHTRSPAEFWSEIISSKFGQYLGFDVLDYNVALYEGRLGCLSKNMLSANQELYHGVDILNDHKTGFILVDKPVFSFQDIVDINSKNALFVNFLTGFTKMLILDALVGNGDRHSENWALIIDNDVKIAELVKQKSKIVDYKKTLRSLISRPGLFFKDGDTIDTVTLSRYKFSPIYDTGSCLGREFDESKTEKMLKDNTMFNAYLNRGCGEVRWENKKVGFFDMISFIKKQKLVDIDNICMGPLYRCNQQDLAELVNTADDCLSGVASETYLSEKRKNLIVKLLVERVERLKHALANG